MNISARYREYARHVARRESHPRGISFLGVPENVPREIRSGSGSPHNPLDSRRPIRLSPSTPACRLWATNWPPKPFPPSRLSRTEIIWTNFGDASLWEASRGSNKGARRKRSSRHWIPSICPLAKRTAAKLLIFPFITRANTISWHGQLQNPFCWGGSFIFSPARD